MKNRCIKLLARLQARRSRKLGKLDLLLVRIARVAASGVANCCWACACGGGFALDRRNHEIAVAISGNPDDESQIPVRCAVGLAATGTTSFRQKEHNEETCSG